MLSKGKTSRGGQIELSGETDVNLLPCLEQNSPAGWPWLERPRPREYDLEPWRSPQKPCHPHRTTEVEWPYGKLWFLSCPRIEILSYGGSQDCKATSMSHGKLIDLGQFLDISV